MKLDDVAEDNLVDRSPKETYRPVREMAAKIITKDVEIRIYNGASREILKNLNNYLWLYYVLSSIQFKYKILINNIQLDCGTVLRSGRFLTHRHVSC